MPLHRHVVRLPRILFRLWSTAATHKAPDGCKWQGPAASALSDMDHWVSAAYSTMSVSRKPISFHASHHHHHHQLPSRSSSTVVKDKSLSTCASIPSWGRAVDSIGAGTSTALSPGPEEEEEEYEAIMADEQREVCRTRRASMTAQRS